MEQSDIRLVDKSKLKSINSVKIDASLNKEQRMRSFIQQIINPYCYLDGDTVVKISYADTQATTRRLRATFSRLTKRKSKGLRRA